jgi:esterase/lipase superfamily enzyme
VGVAEDDDPLPIVNTMAVFVRGNAKCMFENVYALTDNYSQNTSFSLDAPVHSAFGNIDLNADNSFRKYALSGLIQSTYLSGISSIEPPKYNIYFEEFGTIMREAAYFDARYDKAYPALSAQLSPALTRIKGFTASGFTAGAYGAEFLVFNHTDTILNLDSSSGNYLRIQGVALTGESENELTVDDFFDKKSNFSSPVFISEGIVDSPVDAKQNYVDIKLSRLTQGRKDFNIDAPYIQTQDSALSLMEWLTDRIMKPRRSLGLNLFGMPILQLGDIVELDYISKDNFEELAPRGTRFVIYNIEYSRSFNNLTMRVFLSEVPS